VGFPWKAALLLFALVGTLAAACTEGSGQTSGEDQAASTAQARKLPLAWEFNYKNAVHPDATFADITPDGRYVAGWYLEAANGSLRRQIYAWRFDRERKTLITVSYPLAQQESVRAAVLRLHPEGATAVFGAGEPWGLWEVDFNGEHFRRLATLNERLADALWVQGAGWIALTMGGELAEVTEAGRVRGRWEVGAKARRLGYGPDERSVLAISESGGNVYQLGLAELKVRTINFPHEYEYGHIALGARDNKFLLTGQSEDAGTVIAEILRTEPEGNEILAHWELEPLPFAGCTEFGFALLGWLPRGGGSSVYTLLAIDADGKERWRRELPCPDWSAGLNRIRSEPCSWELEVVDDSPHSFTTSAHLVRYRWDAYEWAYAQDYYAITTEGISGPLVSVWLPARKPRDPDAEPPQVVYNYWYIQRGRIRLFNLGGALQAYTMPGKLFAGRDSS